MGRQDTQKAKGRQRAKGAGAAVPLKILFLSSEVQPWSKTGGLSDVAGALPSALAALGHEVTVATPLYASVPEEGLTRLAVELTLRFPFGPQRVGLFEARPAERLRVLFVDHPGSFNRPALYGEGEGYADNHRRFSLFSLGALSAVQALRWAPDVVHLNDWQTGLAALALRRGYRGTELGRAKTLFTVHFGNTPW
jgi:starch synthase